MTSRRKILLALGAGTLAIALPTLAQQDKRVRRIGFFSAGNLQSGVRWLAAFHEGMRELRWVEGRDYAVDARYANGDQKAMPGLAAQLAAWQPDVVIALAEVVIPALVTAMKSVPIVLAAGVDPVGRGFAASLQHPGANVTGLTSLANELGSKRLELLKEAFPRVSHIAALAEPNPAESKTSLPQLKIIEDAAALLKLRYTAIELRHAADIDLAFKRSAALGVNGYTVATGPLLAQNSRAIVEGIARTRFPAIFGQTEYVETGGLMAYSTSLTGNFRRAAAYVDKILKGAKAGDLPIEQPTKFDLVINMKTAKAMGFAIPQSILLRADRVIE